MRVTSLGIATVRNHIHYFKKNFLSEKHINNWNSVLFNQSVQLDVLCDKINIDYDPSLYEACSTLCLNTFQQFKIRLEEAKDYVKQV